MKISLKRQLGAVTPFQLGLLETSLSGRPMDGRVLQ